MLFCFLTFFSLFFSLTLIFLCSSLSFQVILHSLFHTTSPALSCRSSWFCHLNFVTMLSAFGESPKTAKSYFGRMLESCFKEYFGFEGIYLFVCWNTDSGTEMGTYWPWCWHRVGQFIKLMVLSNDIFCTNYSRLYVAVSAATTYNHD